MMRGALRGTVTGTARVPALDYLSEGAGYVELKELGDQLVSQLLRGQSADIVSDPLALTRKIPAYPGVAAIFGSHADDARYIASVLVDTLIDAERRKPAGSRASAWALAGKVVDELPGLLYNGRDPAGCQIAFEDSFARWKQLTPAVSVPKAVSASGWCEKWALLDLRQDGTPSGCAVSVGCHTGIDSAGRRRVYQANPPSDAELRAVSSLTADAPAPPPTHAQIEQDIQAKMEREGETLADLEMAEEMIEAWGYLSAAATARTWLLMSLDLPPAATDKAVGQALASRGITPAEAKDWLAGCDADLECFRTAMNQALGEAEQRQRDRHAGLLLAGSALGAAALVYYALRRR